MNVICDLCGKEFEHDGRKVYAYCTCGSEIQTRKYLSPSYKIKRTLD
jgi:DNA-directed RNA polymerase subunit RPC12/RpoP